MGPNGRTNTKLSVCESQTLHLILGMLHYGSPVIMAPYFGCARGAEAAGGGVFFAFCAYGSPVIMTPYPILVARAAGV